MLPKLNLFNYKPISAPEPLDAYKAAMDDAVQTYDKNLQEAGLLETALSKVRALPADKEYVDKVKDKLKGTLANLASTVQGNKRWDLASDTLNELKLAFTSDQNLQGIQESYKGYLDELDAESKIMESGKTPVNLNMVDWKSHRTLSPDGQLNIYRKKVQPKADYNAEMFELAKTIQPDIDESGLRAAGYDGFLLSEKVKELSDKKIKESLPALFRSYTNTDTYQQQKQIKLKELNQRGIVGEEAEKAADISIANDLKDIASLRVFKEKDNTFMQDPSYAREQNLQNELIKIRARAEAKHSGQSIDDSGLFRPSTEKTKDKKHYDKTVTFGNPNVVNNIKTIVGTPSNDEVFALDGIDIKDKKIKSNSFVPLGLTTINRSGNADWDGAWVGNLTITDSDGKNEQTINAYVKNKDTGVKSNFSTVNNIARALDNKDSKTSMKIPDSSGLITMKIDNEYVPISQSNIELEIIRYKDNTYKVKPVQRQKDGTYAFIPKSMLDKYELKESYSLDELETRSLNNLNPYISTLSLSDKQISQ